MYGGISGLFKLGIVNDQFTTVLGNTLSGIFNLGYLMAGLALGFGIGLKKKEIEFFGLATIATSLLIRMVVIAWLSGFDSGIINLYIVNGVFIIACLLRIYAVFNYEFAVFAIDKTKNKVVAGYIK